MEPLIVSDNRGKASKVTVEVIKHIIEKAKSMEQRGERIAIKQFTQALMEEDQIVLSAKTVRDPHRK